MGCANYLIKLFGVHRFLAEVDRDRQYWREAAEGGVVAEVLDWASNEGFKAFVDQAGFQFDSPHQYRNRDMIRLMEVIIKKGL